MSKFKIYLGDPSDDGHGKFDFFIIESNKTTKEIEQAYTQSCELTGLTFTENSPIIVNGKEIDWQDPEYDDRRICVEYESYNPSDLAWSILNEHGIEKQECYKESFVHLFLKFIKLSLKDLEYSILNDKIEELPLDIGYGLYS